MGIITTSSSRNLYRRSTDPFWDNVVLLMKFDDSSNRLVDLTGRHTPFAVGTPSYVTGRFGSAARNNGDAGTRISIPNSRDFQFGSGDFTIECWFRRLGALNNGAFMSMWRTGPNQRSWALFRSIADIFFQASLTGSGVTINIDTNALESEVSWTHLAVTRAGDTFRVFYNGNIVGSQTLSGANAGAALHPSTQPVDLLNFNDGSPGRGDIDEVRITKGIARYTSNFTPPSASFPERFPLSDRLWGSVILLAGFNGTDASTTLTDLSLSARPLTAVGNAQIDTAQTRYGSASLLLDGTGDAVTTPADPLFNLGSGPFTAEMFIRPVAVTGTQQLLGQWGPIGSRRWAIQLVENQLALKVSTDGSDEVTHLLGGTIVAGEWSHISVGYDGTTYRAYVNGTMVDSTTDAISWSSATPVLAIGANSAVDGLFYNGWIDELRVTKAARHIRDDGIAVPVAAFPRQ